MPRKAEKYTRVTTVLEGLNAGWKFWWAKKIGFDEVDRIGRESRAFGTAIHSVVENYLINSPFKKEPSERERFSGNLLIQWCKEAGIKPIELNGVPAVEVSLVSEKELLTGHPDLICTFGDDPTVWIVDWKSSKSSRLEYPLQMAAYAMMLKEQHGIVADNGVIVRAPSDPNVVPQFQVHPYHKLAKQYLPVFKAGLKVHRYFKSKSSEFD